MRGLTTEYTYGDYRFRGFFNVNINNAINQSGQSVLHEELHLEFTTQTQYGTFMRMCEQVSIIDSRYQYILLHLIQHNKKSQEAVCVFAEILFLIH